MTKTKSPQTREKNPAWKGGRIPRGAYIAVLMPNHPRAVDGYVLEHILVAEQLLGRPLRQGEEVHHRDLNGQNNDPSNICVTASRALHKHAHRKPGSRRRLPTEANTTVECACGCGTTFLNYDEDNRPRRYLHGHNRKRQGSERRLPTETNPLIECACGCDATFPQYDSYGRPRRYLNHHAHQPGFTKHYSTEPLPYKPFGPLRSEEEATRKTKGKANG